MLNFFFFDRMKIIFIKMGTGQINKYNSDLKKKISNLVQHNLRHYSTTLTNMTMNRIMRMSLNIVSDICSFFWHVNGRDILLLSPLPSSGTHWTKSEKRFEEEKLLI